MNAVCKNELTLIWSNSWALDTRENISASVIIADNLSLITFTQTKQLIYSILLAMFQLKSHTHIQYKQYIHSCIYIHLFMNIITQYMIIYTQQYNQHTQTLNIYFSIINKFFMLTIFSTYYLYTKSILSIFQDLLKYNQYNQSVC